ncbi:hypothetical protein J437_LFUL013024 [Ladona fulva]|uniref:DRBM domain-containing protein n=1 Tax=Ladona fulva TaxID=123851 RepID=A0A8K0KN74_LADFU|nr:hypothetical protein J437_LFUL013024 [Ladona fulva]
MFGRIVSSLQHTGLMTLGSFLFLCHSGTGKSKKLAKRQAAFKMLQRLQDTPVEEANLSQGLDDEDEIAEHGVPSSVPYGDSRDNKLSITPSFHKVSQFHRALRSSTGAKLDELQDVADEQQFQITYVDIEEKSISGGECHCLVQLSTLPVAVCFGSGMSILDAQKCAARNALEYLRIMTKKSNFVN